MKITKRNIATCLLLLVAFFAQSQQRQFCIEGSTTPEVYPVLWVNLQYENDKGELISDTCKVKNGLFAFQGQLAEATRVVFWFMPDTSSTLIKVKRLTSQTMVIENTHMKLEYVRSGKYQLTGSIAHDDEKRFLAAYRQSTSAIPANREPLIRKRLIDSFIRSNPASAYSLMLLSDYVGGAIKRDSITDLLNQLSNESKMSKAAARIKAQLEWISKINPGDTVPAFVLPDTTGLPKSLASLRGSYVFLHFWASWCPSCRIENKHLRDAVRELSNQPVAFVGISLDEKKDSWKKAIQFDQLNWLQLNDPKGFDSKTAESFGVKSVPRTFLINPQGQVIEMDLRGDHLAKKIIDWLQ